jgi:hypothetical protein
MRNVYFSFHYQDVWKANQIRQSGMLYGARSAGFVDRSLWEEAPSTSDYRLKRLIEDGLNGTSVTAVLIGQETWSRRWVKYEIRRSVERGNAVVGIHIHSLRDTSGRAARRGRVPHALKANGFPVHDWAGVEDFAAVVEDAWQSQCAFRAPYY